MGLGRLGGDVNLMSRWTSEPRGRSGSLPAHRTLSQRGDFTGFFTVSDVLPLSGRNAYRNVSETAAGYTSRVPCQHVEADHDL